jgi:hypothetical protein
MEDNTADVVPRSLLDARLDLKYVEVFNSGKAIKIVACVIALILAILYLNFSSGPAEFAVGACSLLFAIRLLLGAPTEIQLTPESFQRLQLWLISDDDDDEETDEETSEQ